MAAIAEQELALKQRRRSLEAELVQLYERNPDLKGFSKPSP